MLVGPAFLFLALSLIGLRTPVTISSDPPGTPLKPGMYYLIEDVAAVDFRHGRPYRRQLALRYAASPPFRRLLRELTGLWAFGFALYIAATVAAACKTTFGFAFGFVLGQFFVFLTAWGMLSLLLVAYGRRRELRWWIERTKREGSAERTPSMAEVQPPPAVSVDAN